MRNSGEKKYIPGTDPKWGRELPDDYSNSLVDKTGHNWDNGYNFDERDGDDEPTYDELAEEIKFDPEAAEKAREEAKRFQNKD